MSGKPENTYLVLGGDGLIGRELFSRLAEAGESVWRSSRRESPVDSCTIHLDLGGSFPKLSLPQRFHVALVCVGTNMEACEADPANTRLVNVTNTLRIAEKLLDENTFIQYLSSNAVFDGARPFPVEHTPACTTTEYGWQKVEVEARLLELDRGRGLVGISRLSKVITPAVPAIGRFLERLMQEKPIEAFSDLRLSPISLSYAVTSLLAVARERLGGIFHFSGEAELSYVEFARALTGHLGVSESLVIPARAGDSGVVPLFRPAHPALGMARTREKLAISPQPLDDVFRDLLRAANTYAVS